ncbi:MAG TPA: cytochrome P450 [Acidimicrobiales bacterium]|nr:cytochrome P450 [Acidimicrobiales bacterium]
MTATTDITDTRREADLLDPEFYRPNPHEVYAWMRAHEPVYRDEKNDLWAITRHADVRDVELRSDVFVSGRGYRAVYYPEESNMIARDNPRHKAQRNLVASRFTPVAVRKLEGDVRALVVELLDAVAPAATMEVVDALAAQLPSRTTCRLLGFPDDKWPALKSWSERLMRTDQVFRDEAAMMDFGGATMEISQYVLGELLPEKRRSPGDDLVSVWAHAVIDGEPLDDLTVFNEVGLFIAGGAETTRTSIAHGLRVFCDHPDQWDAMAGDARLVPSAVEEVLRWVTPLNNFFRTAITDTRVGGQPIAEGDRLCLLYPSANRDEDVFPDPYRFDITRNPNPHVAFGFGTHFCLGNHLARLTLRVLLEEAARRFTNLRVVREPDVEANIFARAVRSFTLAFDVR